MAFHRREAHSREEQGNGSRNIQDHCSPAGWNYKGWMCTVVGLWVVLFFHSVSFYIYHSEHFSNLKLQE